MKFGYCVALGLAGLAVLGAVLLYWDVQDGEYDARGVYLAVGGGVLAAVLGLVPGAPVVFRRYAPPGTLAQWLHETPAGPRRVWAGGFVLALALANGSSNYLQGQPFLGWPDVFAVGCVGLLVAFLLRRYLRP
ncbi:MAG: hypothetical protein M3Y54_03140 [Bacteroidota bacterium]|nr:hypothetical protein [Bacteroidota bacterium]